jgi:VanZ family protein
MLLPFILLYPFHFSSPFAYVDNAADIRTNGATFELPGMLLSTAPAPALHATLTKGSGLTVAVWFSSQSFDQKELSRIFTYSLDPWRRNFALGQNGPNLYIRIKLTRGGRHADTLLVQAENVIRPGARQLVVMTYDFKTLRIFVDGKERAAVDRPGHFLDWDPLSYLAVGNEVTGARPWLGTVEAAVIFRAALSETDVAMLFQTDLRLKSVLHADKLVARFNFRTDANDKGMADIVVPIPLPMFERPSYIASESRLAYSFIRGADGSIHLTGILSLWDLIRNVILFIPLGVFVYAKLAARKASAAGRGLIVAMVIGGVVSAGFEGLQILIAERTSSIFDVAANSAGALIGAVMMRFGLHAVPKILSLQFS